MPKCLFCPTEQATLSNEYVFPAALGGTLELQNAVCTNCNNDFSKFEQPLIRELAPIRFLLQIPDRRGNVPQVDATVKTAAKEYEARLKSDGTLVMKCIVTEVLCESGKKEYVHQFLSEAFTNLTRG
jgi:HNH endonuclease